MKKLVSLLLALVMCLSLCACDDNKQKNETNDSVKIPEESSSVETNHSSVETNSPDNTLKQPFSFKCLKYGNIGS